MPNSNRARKLVCLALARALVGGLVLFFVAGPALSQPMEPGKTSGAGVPVSMLTTGAPAVSGPAGDVRTEFFRWWVGVEMGRASAEKSSLTDVQELDGKAATGKLEVTDVLKVYRDQMLPRYKRALFGARGYTTTVPEIGKVNGLLVSYLQRRVEYLARCSVDLERDDKKAFAADQLKFLQIDAKEFFTERDALAKKYAQTR